MADKRDPSRVYQNHHLDSTRWEGFRPRDGDIVIATSYKAGTTWTQAIVANLLFADQDFPAPVWDISPWLDLRTPPLKAMLAALEAQRHRRFIKTHLPFDGLPWYAGTKYIFVSRDGRDVFMSLWNHYSNYNEGSYARYNDTPGRIGAALPRAPADIHDFWRGWCTRGWFPWQQDGWPFWSHLSTTQSWWDQGHLPNLLILHYADMKADLGGAIDRIAGFLEIDLTPARRAAVISAVSFDTMRQQAEHYVPHGGRAWKGGAETFLHKGTNGRWRDLLSADDLALYDAACARALTADCRAWLEKS